MSQSETPSEPRQAMSRSWPKLATPGLLAALVVLWALLFLPHLRTNPDWYGDEGVWLEVSESFARGDPHVGPVRWDGVFPYPYPALYLLVNGAALRVFGNDILVSRALQTLTALATAGLLFWIGTGLRSRGFGFLCAASFLVYPEVVTNLRWARSHPMSGMMALAAVGFLIRYVQGGRLRHIVWAGLFCSLATAASYWSYVLIAAVILTALLASPDGRFRLNWRHAAVAAACAGVYGTLFVLWHGLTQPGGFAELAAQVQRLQAQSSASSTVPPGIVAQLIWFVGRVLHMALWTPMLDASGQTMLDLWLPGAMLGLLLFPVARLRKWLWLWVLTLIFGVIKSRGTVSVFTYPATIFLPVLALGFGGILERLGELAARFSPRMNPLVAQRLPALLVLGIFGWTSLQGSLRHLPTKVDLLTVRHATDAEAASRYVNTHAGTDDFVVVPDQLYWLMRPSRCGQLVHCAAYEKRPMKYFYADIAPAQFRFDCRLQNARYLVLASGQDARGEASGVDAVFWFRFEAIRDLLRTVRSEQWPVVFRQGDYAVLANPRFNPAAAALADNAKLLDPLLPP